MDQYVKIRPIGYILTFCSVMCLTSIDEVAKELENPFRNIPNELPVVTYQAEYNEALITMYSGFHPDAYWDHPCKRNVSTDQKVSTNNPVSHDSEMSTISDHYSESEHGEGKESKRRMNTENGERRHDVQFLSDVEGF